MINIMLYNKFSFATILFYIIVFAYYFVYSYFVSFLAFRDTFLKRRVVKSDERKKLVLYTTLLTTFIYFVLYIVYYIFMDDGIIKYTTTYIVLCAIFTSASMALAIFINTKKIKVE